MRERMVRASGIPFTAHTVTGVGCLWAGDCKREGALEALQAFQNVVYSNIALENRPPSPVTLSSQMLERGIARWSQPVVHAPRAVVTASLKPASANMFRVSGDQSPFGYAKVSQSPGRALSIAAFDARTSRRTKSAGISVTI